MMASRTTTDFHNGYLTYQAALRNTCGVNKQLVSDLIICFHHLSLFSWISCKSSCCCKIWILFQSLWGFPSIFCDEGCSWSDLIRNLKVMFSVSIDKHLTVRRILVFLCFSSTDLHFHCTVVAWPVETWNKIITREGSWPQFQSSGLWDKGMLELTDLWTMPILWCHATTTLV